MTRLLVGSEGTLGVMTEITLRLCPLPEAVSAAICHFPSIDAAVQTTIQIIQMGVPIARCELLDANAIRAVNLHSKLGLRQAPMLLMEFHGSEAGVKEQAETVQDLAREHGGEDFQLARTTEERTKLWPHAIRAISQRCKRARAAAAKAAIPACPSHAWPKASTTALPKPKPRAFLTGSSATWETPTFT